MHQHCSIAAHPASTAGDLPGHDTLDTALAGFARAIAHPVRVRILRMLAQREARQCCDIVGALPLAQSTVSEHLRILKSAGLVRGRDCGGRVAYCIVPEALGRLKCLIAEL